MTHLNNISEEASLVLVSELITALEKQRQANGQPSLVAVLKTALAQTWIDNPQAAPELRVGMADAQLVLEFIEKTTAEGARARHFGDLTVVRPRAGKDPG